jgi:hypothetical protein
MPRFKKMLGYMKAGKDSLHLMSGAARDSNGSFD